jgi:SAM-dependent methyltransferase
MTARAACPVCGLPVVEGRRPWHFACRGCGYEGSDLVPGITAASPVRAVDEVAREHSLRELRTHNFAELLVQITKLKPAGGKLLEVGCAHGWFLDLARAHFDVAGVEADANVGGGAAARGLPVRIGYFPDAPDASERFDVIVFNDVFEHIPAIGAALDQCRSRLNPHGLLVLNLPSTDGIFYRIATLLCRIGLPGAFDRLWQAGLPSPHVHYFNRANLAALLRQRGFEPRAEGTLATLRLAGLYDRIAYASGHGAWACVALYAPIASMLPFLGLMPRDIMYSIATRTAGATAAADSGVTADPAN